LERFCGVLYSPLGLFVPAQVILLSVMRGGGPMSVRGLFMKLRGYSMCIVWHGIPSPIHLIAVVTTVSHATRCDAPYSKPVVRCAEG
jgi:hypothetical protein